MPPKRGATTICEMCCQPKENGLASYAGLQCCKACREGDPEPTLRAWSMRGYFDGGERLDRRDFIADVVLPTVVDMGTLLRKERFDIKLRRLTGDSEPSPGAAGLDEKVSVEEVRGELTREVLKDSVVQAAVVEALGIAHWVKISSERIRLYQSSSKISFKPERDVERMNRAAVALGVAIERWARGEGEGGSLREGCRPRTDEEWPPEE